LDMSWRSMFENIDPVSTSSASNPWMVRTSSVLK
jgi:hypothetical protein